MIYRVYAMRDRKVSAYLTPFYDNQTVVDFVENLKRSILKGQKYDPNIVDCELYYLGDYDDLVGSLHPLESPQFLISMDSLIKVKESKDDTENG